MLKITYTYNGKPFNDLSDALIQSVSDQFKTIVEQKLLPFRTQLNAAGSVVTIDIGEDFQGNISVSNVPDDIKEQVQQALFS